MPSLLDFNSAPSDSVQPTGLGTPSSDIPSLIDRISGEEGVDKDLVRALVRVESNFDPMAKAPTSSAKGLMQLVDGTAKQMGVTNPYDPEQNLRGGIRYLKSHLDSTGGDIDKALRMYNQGPAGDLSKAEDYVALVKKHYGKDFTSTRQSGQGLEDWDSFVQKHGVSPYPQESGIVNKLGGLGIEPIVPDATAIAQGVNESALGRGFRQVLNTPQPELGKLPFGVENKGGPVSQVAKDIIYGVPEGIMRLGAGILGLPGAAVGGVAKSATSGLEAGSDTFNEIAHFAMGTPETATAQYMFRPFDIFFGGIHKTREEIIKDLNPNATPEELEPKLKASELLMNLALVLPMFKGHGKTTTGKPIEWTGLEKGYKEGRIAEPIGEYELKIEDVEAAKEQIKTDPTVPPEVKANIDSVPSESIVDIITNKINKAKVTDKVAKSTKTPIAKFEDNQSIVNGLLVEADLRDGDGRGALIKAAKIVADLEQDAALVDFNPIKGIRVNGSTGKAIARLLEERETAKKVAELDKAGVGEDVPMEQAPVVETPPEVPTSEPAPEVGGGVDPLQSMAQSVYSNLRYIGKTDGIPEAGIQGNTNFSLVLDNGQETGMSISGEVTPEKIAAEVQKTREKFAEKGEPNIDEDLIYSGINPKANIAWDGVIAELRTRAKEMREEAPVEVPKVAEDLPISEFDSTSKAKEEGYTFPDKARYASLDRAKAKAAELGEGHEVVRVKGKYKVAKFEETPVMEFADEAGAKAAGWELMSEVPADKVQFESPSEGFGIVKVGDKFYRVSEYKDMPRVKSIIEVDIPEGIGDGVSIADRKALLQFTDEATLRELEAQDRVRELTSTLKAEKNEGKVVDPAREQELMEAYKKWKDSYVTKSYTAKSKSRKKPTKESLSIVDDAFKTFDSEQAATEWMEANGKVGEIIRDPLTGKYSILDTDRFGRLDELDMWDEGIEQLTERSRIEEDYGTSPDFELSDTGKMDLWSILNNERGSVDVTGLYSSVEKIQSIVKAAEKLGKTVDEYLASFGADEAAIAAFNAMVAQVPQMKQQIKEADPVTSAILMPEGKVVAQKVNKTKDGRIRSVGPPITEDLASRVMNADRTKQWGSDIVRKDPDTGRIRVEHTSNGFENAMRATEVKVNSFRSAGLGDLYAQWREAKKMAQDEKAQVKEWIDNLEKQIAPERRKAFAIAAYADMKSVREAFNAMGITEIPELTSQESIVLEQLLDYTRKFRDRSNYVRTHTGQKAIPQLKDMKGRENYLPLMRDLNVLRDLGITEGMTISDTGKLGELSKNFNGMFNPHSKKRNVSDIPIELDPFRALRRHAEYGIDEIHISPVAALAKDLANVKLPRVDQPKGKISLSDWNPYLSQMLSRWSDQIVGKDVVATAIANANPFFSWAKDRLSKNLVIGTIGGALRTILVQPISYMIGVPTMLDMRSTGYGLWRLLSDSTDAKKNSSVLAIREADYAFSELAEYIKQGKISGTKAYLAEKSLAPMKWVDSVMAEASWNAAKYYGEKRLKLQGKELYRFADDVVERTQGLGIKGAVSDIQSSAATKWLTLLQTFAIADFNLIARDVLGIKNPELNQSKTIARVAKYVGATILAGQMYKMIGMENVVPDPIGAYLQAKEDGKGDLRAVGSAAGELLEKIPLIGGSAKFGSNLFGIAGEWGQILPEAGEKFAASLDWDRLTPKQKSYNIRLLARAVGLTMGIPMTNQILKSINSSYKGGNPWEIILGVYDKEKRGGRMGVGPTIPTPNISIPTPGL